MRLDHPQLVELLRKAFSAERAAAFAYVGHAQSVRDGDEKRAIRQIEIDEWSHREAVGAIMRQYDIPVSRYYELKYYLIGRVIGYSCHVIGWFMPFYFAGRLESGNVCEYFRMMRYFDELGISEHDGALYEMGMKEKEHEVYFLEKLQAHRLLPLFERVFSWGNKRAFNDVDLDARYAVPDGKTYCGGR